jgi:hypothetical protein
MKRRHHPWLPTPDELATAPSLAIVSALGPTLDVIIVALTAAHHELQPTANGRDAATSTIALAADDVILAAQALAQAISCYRLALLDHLASRRA